MNDLNLLDKYSKQTTEEMRALRTGRFILLGMIGLVLIASVLELLANALIRYDGFWSFVPAIFTGLALAGPFLAPVLFALLDCPWPVRLVGIVGSLTPFAATTLLGSAIFSMWVPATDFQTPVEQLIAFPSLILSWTLPFLIMRSLIGWHIVIESWFELRRTQHLTIGGLLVFTVLIAICVSTARASHDVESLVRASIITTGVGMLIGIPLVYLMFRSHRRWIWLAAFFSAPLFGISFVTGSISFGLAMATAVGTVGVTMIGCYLCGARLILNQDIQRSTENQVQCPT